METIHRDYGPQGVQFYYIYKSLAHPGLNGYVTPFTLQERLHHVQEARRKLGSEIEWLCDNMDNQVQTALGGVPNSEFVIDPQGRVIHRQAWSSPTGLRRFLEETIGPVENPTQVTDLDMHIQLEPDSGSIPTGVVPPLRLPGRMTPLLIEPQPNENDETPFYAKLRAEVQPRFFREGQGDLYLGFHLDRLYAVHWNNETPPLEFEVEAPAGIQLTPAGGSGPKVEPKADKDPREFLLQISSKDFDKPLNLTVRYFACDDANTFCVPVTQSYRIEQQRDPHGGQRRRGGPSGRGDFRQRIWQMDSNEDGLLERGELPPPLQDRFDRLDSNGDGFLDEEEVEAMPRRMGPPGGGGPGRFIRRLLEHDADGDGKISQEEAPPFLRGRFPDLDLDGDGFIDRQELEERRRGAGRPPRH